MSSNPITAASSSTTGDITGGRRRVKTAGIPTKCSCGARIVELISKSTPNPHRRYYWCHHAASLRLDYHVRILEEEVQLLKATIRSEGPKKTAKISGCFVPVIVGISVVVVLAGITMYK
ncbi:hypothetical protein YC2023_002717 [Brassica napus]